VKKHNITLIVLFFFVTITGISFGYDITKFLYMDLKGEFNSPLVLNNAEKVNYVDGWRNLNSSPTAVKKISKIKFFLIKRRDIKIHINIEKNQKLKEDLDINILINEKFFKKIKVKSIMDLTLFIPLDFLIQGDNIISFSIDNKNREDNLFKTCTDMNFFIVKRFEFKSFSLNSERYTKILMKNRFIQPVNTKFSIFVTPETEESINLEFFKFKKRGNGDLLEINFKNREGDSEIFKIIELSEKVEKLNIGFKNLKKDSNYIFSFKYSSPDSDNYIVWRKVEIIEKGKIEKSLSFSPVKNHFINNIFLIVFDAFRKDLINKIVGGKEVTPNVNKLFAVSNVYNKCYSTAPYTVASVSSMLSGFLPETHTVRRVDNIFPEKIKTLPFFLKINGYKSYAFIGNPVIVNSKITKDFDKTTLIYNNPNRSSIKKPVSKNNINKVLTAIRNLKGFSSNFFYIHLLPPHPPYNPPGKQYKIFSALSANNNYQKMKECKNDDIIFLKYLDNAYYADSLAGMIFKELKKQKLFNDSLIIFTSDHGEEFCDHGNTGHGSFNYNELIHVPFFVKFPHQSRMLNVSRQISLVDLTPSIVYMIYKKKYFFYKGICNIFSKPITVDNNNFIYSRAVGENINSSVVFKNKKFILNSGSEEYFNLIKDPGEKINLARDRRWESAFFRHAIYKIISDNLLLKKKMNIKMKKKNFSDKKIKELKTLGYLL